MSKPIKTFKTGISLGTTIAVWENDGGNLTFTIAKRYKDKQGNWQESKSFFVSDLAALQQLIPMAISFSDAKRAAAARAKSQPAAEESGPPEDFDEVPALSFDDEDIPF